MERELRAERAAAGCSASKARDKSGGRPRIPTEKLEDVRILYENSHKTAKEIGQSTGISRRTLFSYLVKHNKLSHKIFDGCN